MCSCSGLSAIIPFFERTYSVAIRRRTALGVVLEDRALAFNSSASRRGSRMVSVSVIHPCVTRPHGRFKCNGAALKRPNLTCLSVKSLCALWAAYTAAFFYFFIFKFGHTSLTSPTYYGKTTRLQILLRPLEYQRRPGSLWPTDSPIPNFRLETRPTQKTRLRRHDVS